MVVESGAIVGSVGAAAAAAADDSDGSSPSPTPPMPLRRMVIVGTGLMGTGIAQVAVETLGGGGGGGALDAVTMVGRSAEKCEAARAKIAAGVTKTARRRLADADESRQRAWVDAALSRLRFVTDLDDAPLAGADVCVETVVENLKVKQRLFAELEARVRADCLLVTNTSSFLLADVGVKLERRERFGGLHFFNPVPAMRLVEVVLAADTSTSAAEALVRLCERLGKTPVRCRDSPGFIVNRLLVPYLADAMRLTEGGANDNAGGVAAVADIDAAMRLGAGHPMGPFELMDYIGLDTMKFILDGWHQRYPEDARFTPSARLDALVGAGKLGRKSGEGFHRYH